MELGDKAKQVAEEIAGKAKEGWGAYTGNPALEAEGEAEFEAAREEDEQQPATD